ncbi:uncharacterized protein LOC123511390 [Portunus trituberculatus]|uniref:uncharacterized protein LOC123511390 n=1 Tax=Portunus trituberculatus TaxID=210409 RepID=UPI001E1D1BF4|nr:uncharacterized protein LOC123511390 [Portunus trituberculatus]
MGRGHPAAMGQPHLNPCAAESWQLLLWPRDSSCHRIFTQGPCGETQEFYFNVAAGEGQCRCPRGSLLHPDSRRCHSRFSRGPCLPREYIDRYGKDLRHGEGTCRPFDECPPGQVFWPPDGQCYQHHTRGPCLNGYLIYVNPNTGFPDCGCERTVMFSNYWALTGLCFELFQRGPCLDGTIFLYNATRGATQCGCSPSILTNYHQDSGSCYELGQRGPCRPGQLLAFSPDTLATRCTCRPDHALWSPNGACYLLYSRGPCSKGHFFIPATNGTGKCQLYPCSGTRRYHPSSDTCYRLGRRGPCPLGSLFIYDEDTPLRGTCGCMPELVGFWPKDSRCYEVGSRGPCPRRQVLDHDKTSAKAHCICDLRKGYIAWEDDSCHLLNTRGPCPAGQRLMVKQWRPLTPVCTSDPAVPLTLEQDTPGADSPSQFQMSNSVTAARGDDTFNVGDTNATLAPPTSTSLPGPAPAPASTPGTRSGRSMSAGGEARGLLDSTHFLLPEEDDESSTFYTGHPEGRRSLDPWWGTPVPPS